MAKERTFRVCFEIKGKWLHVYPNHQEWNIPLQKGLLRNAVVAQTGQTDAKVSNITVEEIKDG